MKRLWISGGILLLLLAGAMCNAWIIGSLTGTLTHTLAQAEAQAEEGHWEEALRFTREAQEQWDASADYLYIVLRHSDTDQVDEGFQTVEAYLEERHQEEYSAANAQLIAKIDLLYEMEAFTLRNLL